MRLLKLLLIGLVATSLLMLVSCGGAEDQPAEEPEQEAEMGEVVEEAIMAVDHVPLEEEFGTEATCPVCGMTVTVAEGTLAVEYDGDIYYFCNVADKDAFAANPTEYLMETEDVEATEEVEGDAGH